MRMFLVQIEDVEAGKFKKLLALQFFMITVRHAVGWDSSKDEFLIT